MQLVTGYPIFALVLATTVNGAILEFAFEDAGTVMKQVPLFTPGNANISPWTLTKLTVTLLKPVLGRLHTTYTTPVVLTVDLLLRVTTALGLNRSTRLIFPCVYRSAGLGVILKKYARRTFTLLNPLLTGPIHLPPQRKELAMTNVPPPRTIALSLLSVIGTEFPPKQIPLGASNYSTPLSSLVIAPTPSRRPIFMPLDIEPLFYDLYLSARDGVTPKPQRLLTLLREEGAPTSI